ncbi:hypothetical protein [Chiayiivirga flava]|uniref:Energy transducer TonB n=1 Tax=Chiayiivirga flava TaxID=659595 RepID=A0A7W8D4X4_9GAMM|nr:hypothetical protein [Chiayiivirga flava]MBB5207989.1 hypothetical protein [Chiayiivirga flava]
MPFRSAAAFVLAAILPLAAASAAEPHPEAELEIGVVGDLEIGPDGAVRTYEVTSKLAEPLTALVERKVREWMFEPIAVDGKPVIAKTRARLTLRAIPQGDDYQLRIEGVHFGEAAPSAATTLKAPTYPRNAIREGIGARVMLVARLDADGRVIEVHPYQTSLDKPIKSDFTANKWRTAFERASIAAVEDWRYDLTESIDGATAGQTVMIPIQYSLSYGRTSAPNERWRQYIPGPVSPAPWQDDSRIAQLDDIGEGETRSLSSRFRLTRDPTGTVL